MKDIAEKFLKVFDGYDEAYGQHGNFSKKENGKMEGKAQTIYGQIPDDVVLNHLSGEGNGLGIVPLKQDNTCSFGAIDIDIVGINPLKHSPEEMESKITLLGIPLVVCTTKSKGIHLYCFTKTPVPSELLVRRLKEWASVLGYGTAEIFPKQTYRINSQDVGNWINLPYYNHKETTRLAINKGQYLKDINEFFELVEVVRISEDELENFKLDIKEVEGYDDAPPCLQVLASMGIEEGSRNNGVYNFGVYFKMKDEDNWQDKLLEASQTIINPPLSMKEVEAIVKSVNRKNFFYKCKEYPICQHCNKTECRKRKYGIGSSTERELNFDNLTKYISGEEVTWFAEYQGQRIQLNTDELLNQNQLQKRMIEAINKTFTPKKPATWLQVVDGLLSNCTVVVEPVQASRKGQFFELLDAFLIDGVAGSEKEDILKYNTYVEEGSIFFRSIKLFEYLKNKRFKHSEHEIWIWIKEKGAKSLKVRIKKKTLNIWSLPVPENFQQEDLNEGEDDRL